MLKRMQTIEVRPDTRQMKPWPVVALLFLVAVLNYFDRQSLSVVAPRMQSELHFSNLAYGHIVSLFLLASAFAYALSGFLCDAIGTRRSMALFVSFWSLAEAATGFASSAFLLGLTRFCLGLGEPGLWVAAPKAVGEVVERSRRSLAVGIYTAGATFGAIIAIPAILAVTSHLPWRTIFVIDGAAGLLWVPLWLWIYKEPLQKTVRTTAPGAGPLLTILRQRQTWLFMIARGVTDPVWYFYLFWFPKYLLDQRHISLGTLSRIGWIVYLAGGLGTVFGGFISGLLIRRGRAPVIAYRIIMMISAFAVLVSPMTALSTGLRWAFVFACIVAFSQMCWLTNLTSALLEIFPPEQVGKAAGLVAAGSAFGGMVSSEIIAHFVSKGGYTPVFFIMGFMHMIAIALLWNAFVIIPRIEEPAFQAAA
jgi:ACS family hexuronate transporter-like MFS transporter